MVLFAWQRDDFVQEISQGQYDDAGILVHYFEEPSDLESSYAQNIEGRILFGAVRVYLLPDEVFELEIVALAEQLKEFE